MTNYINCSDEKIALPLPPVSHNAGSEAEQDVYVRFMRHLRHVPNTRMEIKILSAIQFTADLTNHSDAHVAKVLVDYGLRAPRVAFPAEFLRFADQSLMRSTFDVGGPSKALQELHAHWLSIGEDRFEAICGGEYALAGRSDFLQRA